MSILSIDAKLFRASQQAYDVGETGTVAFSRPFDQIGWLAEPTGFAAAPRNVDAALVGETATEIIVAFRGTLPPLPSSPDLGKVFRDWLGNFNALPVSDPNLPGRVHKGFAEALEGLWPALAPKLGSGKPLCFTGHSKGGAHANLAAARFVRANPQAPAPKVVTFAGAKVGDAAFQAAYDAGVPDSLRYENRDDIVPHVPLGLDLDVLPIPLPRFAEGLVNMARGYCSVGRLKYINFDGAIVAAAPRPVERLRSLFTHGLNPVQMIIDHLPGDIDGYGAALLPPDLAVPLNPRDPQVSPVVYGFRT